MSAAEYYNVGPDYHQQSQQSPAPAQQQAYPLQGYPQHPQPVRPSFSLSREDAHPEPLLKTSTAPRRPPDC
ncbi:hypothetical protein IMZ48_01255 [Candidatus Bathyarchaeota archaeon]|nr:hypothetical protein [Candidatus Bathyarchaeota archaeon]